MGVAAYNRGSKAISDSIARDYASHSAFRIMDRINALPKRSTPELDRFDFKRRPLLGKYAIEFDRHRNVWWMCDPDKMYEGYSMSYPSLEKLVLSWDDLYLTGYDEITNIWTAEVLTKSV